MVAHDPNYAGGHFAVGLAAEHRGDVSNARAELTLAAQQWSKADPTLHELSQVRNILANLRRP
jgi:hypothetical protein